MIDKKIKFMIIRCFIPLYGIIETLRKDNILYLKKYDFEFYVIIIQSNVFIFDISIINIYYRNNINKLKNNIMHLKQENKYGCGLYAIANALQYKQIRTEERIELSKEGNNIGQLNKWLIEDNLDVWVSVLKYDFENIIEIFDLKAKFDKFEQSE